MSDRAAPSSVRVTETTAYVVAAAVLCLAALVPGSDAVEDRALSTLLVSTMLALSMASTRIGLAIIVLSFPMDGLRATLGPFLMPMADLAALGILASTGVRWLARPPSPRENPLLRWYLPVAAVAVLSAALADERSESLHYALRFHVFYGVAYLGAVLPAIRQDPELCRRGLVASVAIMSVVSLGLAYHRIFFLGDLWAAEPVHAGPFGEAQEGLGVEIAVLWPWVRRRGRPFGLLETVAFLAIVLSFARTAWLILLAVTVVERFIEPGFLSDFAVLVRRMNRLMIGVLLLVSAAAATLTILYLGSFMERAAMWVGAVEYWLDSPILGHGPGTIQKLLVESAWIRSFLDDASIFQTDAHGFVIKLLPEVGLAGLVFFFSFLVVAFIHTVRSLRTRDRGDYLANAACVAVLVGAVLNISAGVDILSARFWFVLALVMGTLRYARRHHGEPGTG